MGIRDQIIPARFLLTLGHFVSVCLITYTKEDNIYAVHNSATSKQKSDAVYEIQAAVNVAIVCFCFDFIGMFSGSSLFMNKVNLLQCLVHFIGGVLVSTFIHDSWAFTTLWPLVLAFNITTAVVELGVLFAVHILKVVMYGGD
mmetsp:Transcript_48913/g.98419  ORF Transcript_48913/g.98419 Transcript_48913/m.98419 type:complete len:143 (-) Transcript_48913:247-675(-)